MTQEINRKHRYLHILLPVLVGLFSILITVIILPKIRSGKAETPILKSVFPRLANVFLEWELTDDNAAALAKYDFLVLDMETQKRSPDKIKKIRVLNSKIKIVAYISSEEIRDDVRSFSRAAAPMRNLLADGIKDSWWLKKSTGEKISFWPGTYMLNVAEDSDGEGWNEYLPRFVNEQILSSGLWDGVFYDNTFPNVTSFIGDDVDLDNDGARDAASAANNDWREGMIKIFETTRRLAGTDKLILGNGGTIYAPYFNGRLFENFARGGWSAELSEYKKVAASAQIPRVAVINANAENTGRREDFQKMRFGLGSSLLFDGFYSFDDGDAHHNQTWWYDEYNANLGLPAGEAKNLSGGGGNLVPGLWRRDFERGVILVNSTDNPQTADLLDEYERLRGVQDIGTNSGERDSVFTIPPKDALVLLRPIGFLENASFINGAYVKIFGGDGVSVRNGFFNYKSDYRGGAYVIVFGQYKAVSSGGEVAVTKNNNEVGRFWPYGGGYRGRISLAFGDLGDDGVPEIILLNQDSAPLKIQVHRLDGSLIKYYFPYGQKSKHRGASIAAADFAGDGTKMVLGSPAGVRAEIRIFDAGFNLIRSFRAYGAGFVGGVNVALGDFNGDGKKEILAGAAAAGGPHIRIFDYFGKAFGGGFFAFSSKSRAGVAVSTADTDGDGKDEIIAMSNSVFTIK